MIKTGKKLIIILGVAALNLAVTGMLGCGSGKEEEPTVTQVENTEEPAEETAEKTEELSMKWCLYVKKPPIGRLFWQENRYSLSFPSSRKIMVMPHRPATPTSA